MSAETSRGTWASISAFYSKRPWIGFAGSVASLASLVLALYFAQGPTPRLTLKVSDSRSVIVTKNRPGNLRVLSDDKEIAGDVTAVQLALWNAGSGIAREATVLEHVRIVTVPPTPILSATLQKSTRAVTGIALDTSSLADGTVGVVFKILEPGDGGLLQLVYAGPVDIGIKAEGVLEQQPAITSWGGGPADLSTRVKILLVGVGATFFLAAAVVLFSRRPKQELPVARRLWEVVTNTLAFSVVWTLLLGMFLVGLELMNGRPAIETILRLIAPTSPFPL